MDGPRVDLLGDRALLVTLAREISEPINDLVLNACEAIEAARIPGVEEAQPAYSSFCVHFDPSKVGAPWLGAYVQDVIRRFPSDYTGEDRDSGYRSTGREVEIPVEYGGKAGPDLDWAAEHLGISREEIVRRHSTGRYRVYMIGFAPGFPYLGGMDKSISLPRLPTPRTTVPPGSVAIGGGQTGIYPWESPGGWRIIGRTPMKLFAPRQEDPSLLNPGDVVRFAPVNRAPDATLQADDEKSPVAIKMGEVAAFLVEHPGFLSLVVDKGRGGYRKLGVPVSGAADMNSYTLANILCGNSPSAPALEMTLWGARLRALMSIVVAVTGAPSSLSLDGAPVPMNEPFVITEGSLLEVGSPTSGCRMYLAASGGFSVPRVMGSASTYLRGSFGGFGGRRLLQGDRLRTRPGVEYDNIYSDGEPAGQHPTPRKRQPVYRNPSNWPKMLEQFLREDTGSLRIVPGPESASGCGEALLNSLCNQVYVVRTDSDRMGIRFDGPTLESGRGDGDIVSSPVVPGVIQVPSDGMPVLLLCDAQTCGGYRRIATVVSEDLPLAGQMRPGSRVKFTLER